MWIEGIGRTASSEDGGAAWNRCDVCGRFIGLSEFYNGTATREMELPESAFSTETYLTLHGRCDWRKHAD